MSRQSLLALLQSVMKGYNPFKVYAKAKNFVSKKSEKIKITVGDIWFAEYLLQRGAKI